MTLDHYYSKKEPIPSYNDLEVHRGAIILKEWHSGGKGGRCGLVVTLATDTSKKLKLPCYGDIREVFKMKGAYAEIRTRPSSSFWHNTEVWDVIINNKHYYKYDFRKSNTLKAKSSTWFDWVIGIAWLGYIFFLYYSGSSKSHLKEKLMLGVATVLLFILALFSSLITYGLLDDYIQSKKWPAIRATVLNSGTKEHWRSSLLCPIVRVKYVHERVERTAIIHFSKTPCKDKQVIENILDKYSKGSKHLVYFNAKSPHKVTLKKGQLNGFLFLFLPVSILLIGITTFLIFSKKQPFSET